MLKLTRFAHLPTAEIGLLTAADHPWVIWTLERPWLDNAREISCIPAGRYQVRRWTSKRFPRALEVLGEEPHRSDILFHAANRVDQLRGCIAPGLDLGGDLNGSGLATHPTLSRSRPAVDLLWEWVGERTIGLEIANGPIELFRTTAVG